MRGNMQFVDYCGQTMPIVDPHSGEIRYRAQIIPQVMRGHPMEPHHPLLQPPTVSIHMLNVIRTHHPLSRPVVYHLVRYPLPLAETCVHPSSIAAKHRIGAMSGCNTSLTVRASSLSLQLEVGQVACSVLHHHHRDVIRSCATGAAFATTATGRAGQSALPFKRRQEEGFIHLDNALFPRCLMGRHGLQEAVTPQEGGVFADPAAKRGLPDGEPFNERLGVVLPALGLAQSGHGGVGED